MSSRTDPEELRRKAEERHRERAAAAGAASPEDLRRLVNELGVHRIELEMQNEELRRVQAELEASRARYFDFYDLAPVGYLTLDGEGSIVDANLTAARMLGVERANLVGQPLGRFVDSSDRDAVYLLRQELLRTGAQQVREVEVRSRSEKGGKDEQALRLRLRASLVQVEGGATECRVILSDITELDRAMERFRDLVRDVTVAIVLADGETKRFVFVNRAACRLLGYGEEELLRMGVDDLHPPESLEHVREEFDRHLRGEILVASSLPFRRKDGTVFYADVSASSVHLDGRACLAGFFVDVTARRDAELEYRTVVETAIDGFAIVSPEGRLLEVNDSYCRTTGYTRAELLGMRVPENEAERSAEELAAHMARLASGGSDRFRSRIRRKDGRLVDVDVNVQRSSLRGGVFVAFMQDITVLKRTEAELAERLEDLAESERILRLERIAKVSEAPSGAGREARERPPPDEAACAASAPSPGSRRAAAATVSASPSLALFGKAVPWGVLLLSLLLTLVSWQVTRGETARRARERFDFRVATVESRIRERLAAYEQMLRAGAGLFSASVEVSRDEWRVFVTNLRLGPLFPGVQGLGFAERILPADKEAHVRRVRAEGFPRYDVWPAGDRPEYTSIVFLEPFDERNQRAFGYDMLSEPVRREAMTRARVTGLPTASGKVTLVQETDKDRQAGFLLYLPVYRNGAPAETAHERLEALRGWVYSPFRLADFMSGILDPKKEEVDLAIFSGGQARAEDLLFRGGPGGKASVEENRPRFAAARSTLEFGGHRWLLTFSSSRLFEERLDGGKETVALSLGLLVSGLLSGLAWFLVRSRGHTDALARMTSEVELANQLRTEVESRLRAEEALYRHAGDLDAFNDAMVGREARVIEMKEEVNRLSAELGREPRYPAVWKSSRSGKAGDPGRK